MPPRSAKRVKPTHANIIDLQRGQFKRLGVLGDWENPYLTLNKEYEADELRLFADIVARALFIAARNRFIGAFPAAPRSPKPKSNIKITSARVCL